LDEFNSQLENLADLSDEELGSLEQQMVAAFDDADANGDVDTMQQLADALDLLRVEQNRRAGTVEEPAPATDTGAEVPDQEMVAASAEVDDTGAESEGEAVEVTRADVPEENQPTAVAASAGPSYSITAGGDIPGVTAGQQLDGMDEIINALVSKINTMRGVSGDGEHVIVASLRRDLEEEYGDDRLLRRGDPEGNSAKIRNFVNAHHSEESLVASAWCAPRTPQYDIPGIGSTATPVADSLASFGVDRGGIIWQDPPSLADFSSALATLGVWKNVVAAPGAPNYQFVAGTDPGSVANPATTKPCIDIPCGAERSADLYAVPLCLCFDVLMSRANPEMVKAATDLIMVGHARYREQYLLAQMFSAPGITNADGAGTIGDQGTVLGAARDMLVQLRLVSAQFRWRNRISQDTQLRVYLPAWLLDAMAADLAIQMPGDDTLSVSNSEITGYFNDINVSPVWYMDDVPVGIGTGATTAGSNFDTYTGFPTPVEWLLTLPGVFTRLDGGSLDIGVVRDKTLVTENKFCEFAETFENAVYMGPTGTGEAWALRGTTAVSVRGGFAPAIPTIGDPGIVP